MEDLNAQESKMMKMIQKETRWLCLWLVVVCIVGFVGLAQVDIYAKDDVAVKEAEHRQNDSSEQDAQLKLPETAAASDDTEHEATEPDKLNTSDSNAIDSQKGDNELQLQPTSDVDDVPEESMHDDPMLQELTEMFLKDPSLSRKLQMDRDAEHQELDGVSVDQQIDASEQELPSNQKLKRAHRTESTRYHAAELLLRASRMLENDIQAPTEADRELIVQIRELAMRIPKPVDGSNKH